MPRSQSITPNVPHNQRGNHPRTSNCPAAGSCGCCMSKFPSLLAQALALLLPLCLLPLLFHYGLLFGLRFCPIGSRSLSFDRRRLFVVQWVGRSFKPSPIQSYNIQHNQRGNYPHTPSCPPRLVHAVVVGSNFLLACLCPSSCLCFLCPLFS